MSSRKRTPVPFAGLAALVAAGAALLVLLLATLAVAFVRPTVSREAAATVETVGGLRYGVNNAWILDPRRRVDAAVAKGLPPGDVRLPADELLYSVFVRVANETGQPRPSASAVALRDTRNRDYAPVRIGAGNRYAYRPAVVPARSHVPAGDTPAATDLAAGGLMLVFRIPRRSYDDGPLQLVVHDPAHPSVARTVPVA